jgi:hypothetical protein
MNIYLQRKMIAYVYSVLLIAPVDHHLIGIRIATAK